MSDYKYGNSSSSDLTKYNQSDSKTVLESADDAASQVMGSDWRMPTKDEFQELLSNTNKEWITNYNGSGVNGYKFTSKINGNSIFIPASGYCNSGSVGNVGNRGYVWSSSLNTSIPSNAWGLGFYSGDCYVSNSNRYGGRSVRGVRK